MATLECEIQYCPFKSSGEEAQSKHNSQEQKETKGKKLLRRATKSIITTDHKGVLTVQIVSASNLSVCLLSGTAIQSFSLLVHRLSHSQRKQQQSLSLCIITTKHKGALAVRIISASNLSARLTAKHLILKFQSCHRCIRLQSLGLRPKQAPRASLPPHTRECSRSKF